MFKVYADHNLHPDFSHKKARLFLNKHLSDTSQFTVDTVEFPLFKCLKICNNRFLEIPSKPDFSSVIPGVVMHRVMHIGKQENKLWNLD